MPKKVPKKILRIERNFFVNLRKKCFWPPTPRRRRQFFWTGPPPTEIDRRAAADTMTSAHSSNLAFHLSNYSRCNGDLIPLIHPSYPSYDNFRRRNDILSYYTSWYPFINAFIQCISIAHLQIHKYSEALQTQNE